MATYYSFSDFQPLVRYGAHQLENCSFVERCYSSTGGGGDEGSSGGDKIDLGLRLGDYPVLPWRSAQLNRQTGWWDNQDRRDKETPVSNLFYPFPTFSLSLFHHLLFLSTSVVFYSCTKKMMHLTYGCSMQWKAMESIPGTPIYVK